VSLLNPSATYYATLEEQLGLVGRALAFQRAVAWFARGLVVGLSIDLAIMLWAWTREAAASVPVSLWVVLPLSCALIASLATLLVRHTSRDLARRVDVAAGLQERSVTALELGGRGADHPLALAQMRDAVEHLRRVEPLETFPPRAPRHELFVAAVVAALVVIFAFIPNPWLLSARVANPQVSIARDQAEKVNRLADSLQPQNNPELAQLQDLLRKGSRTIDTRSSQPEEALAALEDLEQAVRDMSAGDDQLSASLAAISSALAGDPSTQQLAAAINTGDMNEISRATRDLAQRTAQMDSQQQQRVATVLRAAADRAGRASSSVAVSLANAASALQAGAGGQQAIGASGETGDQSNGDAGQSAQAAQDALNTLANSTDAAAARQRASNQLQASQNALERALGRAPSRSAANSGGPGSSTSNGQQGRGNGQSSGDQGQGQSRGQGGSQGQPDRGQGGDQPGGGGSSGDNNPGDGQNGGGYSTGGQNLNRTGDSTGLDGVLRPEQVPSDGSVTPDTSSENPYLGQAGNGDARVGQESVNPSYQGKSTQGGDSASIPIGLRDLVKDYFSSLDHK
jgi:hypothetical protein